MKVVGRDDNMPVTKLGLSKDIVNKLSECGVMGWDDLTALTLKQLAEMGLKPNQVTEVSDAVMKYTQHTQ